MFDYDPKTEILALKCLPEDGKTYGGFRWNTTIGAVNIAPDWSPIAECVGGLHAWAGAYIDLWASRVGHPLWLVVALPAAEVVHLDGKVKAPWVRVLMAGERRDVCTAIAPAVAWAVPFATVSGGDRATVSGGHKATVSGGDRAMVSGGYRATVTGGDWATVTGGDWATVSGGYGATVSGGDCSTLCGGASSTYRVNGEDVAVFFRGANGRWRVEYPDVGVWRAAGDVLVAVAE